ncbi:C-C motif chemokine 2-like [Silurus asotus]|uniref:C-C motif chemokine 2-like n=1 Tax=Silurus asotus TaxID=30991 RepID=A0AAD5AII3_SILAS|nr:C-C motif chemokine 2-like [Silurus asotus]
MRNLTTLLFVLSLCSLYLVSSAPLAFDQNISCCSTTTNIKIPIKRIVTCWRTSSSCTKKAIVFETVNGNQRCVDPTAEWVNGHMKALNCGGTTSTPKSESPQ